MIALIDGPGVQRIQEGAACQVHRGSSPVRPSGPIRPFSAVRPFSPVRVVQARSRGSMIRGSGGDGTCGEIRLFTSTALYATTTPRADPLRWSDVVSLHPVGVPRSPLSVHVDEWDALVDAGFGVGDRVSLRDGSLMVSGAAGNVVVCDFADAHEWTGSCGVVPITSRAVDDALGRLAMLNQSSLPAARARMASRVDALVAALCDGSDPSVGAAVRGLVGFGPGLTPSGDDVLAGCLVALLRWNATVSASGRLERAVAKRLASPNATGFVGRQLLELARLGFTHEALDDVLLAVPHGGSALVLPAGRLLSVGATSGADSLLGIECALRVFVTLTQRDVPR